MEPVSEVLKWGDLGKHGAGTSWVVTVHGRQVAGMLNICLRQDFPT